MIGIRNRKLLTTSNRKLATGCGAGVGACCFEDETCGDGLTESECTAQNGLFQGAGTNCVSADCSTGLRACCFESDLRCETLSRSDCISQGGAPGPVGSSCATTNCSEFQTCPPNYPSCPSTFFAQFIGSMCGFDGCRNMSGTLEFNGQDTWTHRPLGGSISSSSHCGVCRAHAGNARGIIFSCGLDQNNNPQWEVFYGVVDNVPNQNPTDDCVAQSFAEFGTYVRPFAFGDLCPVAGSYFQQQGGTSCYARVNVS